MIKTPLLTTDGIIEVYNNGRFEGIVLIERANEPKGLALPGGFVDVGEKVEKACAREMAEETALDVKVVKLLGVYSDPERDPRFHTASCVYICQASGTPKGGDDAKTAKVYSLVDIPFDDLVFDHAKILMDYVGQIGG